MHVTIFYLYLIRLLLYIFILKKSILLLKKDGLSNKREHVEIKMSFTITEIGEKKNPSFTDLFCDVGMDEIVHM